MPRARPVTAVQGHAIRCDLDALDEDMYVPVDTTSFVGTMTYPCVHCRALKFHGELHNNSCCQLSDSWRPCRLCHYLLCSSSNSSSALRAELHFFVSTFVSSTQLWLLQVWESVKSSWAGAYLLFVFTALHITSWAHWLGVPMTSRNSPCCTSLTIMKPFVLKQDWIFSRALQAHLTARALNILTILEQVIAGHNPFHDQFFTAIAAAERAARDGVPPPVEALFVVLEAIERGDLSAHAGRYFSLAWMSLHMFCLSAWSSPSAVCGADSSQSLACVYVLQGTTRLAEMCRLWVSITMTWTQSSASSWCAFVELALWIDYLWIISFTTHSITCCFTRGEKVGGMVHCACNHVVDASPSASTIDI